MLSSLPFGSFLSYSPNGTTREEQLSIAVCQELKRDGHLGAGREPILAHAVARLRRLLTPELAALLAPDVLLVPMPGHAPLPPRQPHAHWLARRLCEELLQAGFGRRCAPLLVRLAPVPKSAAAPRGARPTVQQHYDSLSAVPTARAAALIAEGSPRRVAEGSPRRVAAPAPAAGLAITLVDDVVTKGATLLAGASRLAEAFPGATVRAFALVRTQCAADHPRRRQRFRALVDPVSATITLGRYGAWRHDP